VQHLCESAPVNPERFFVIALKGVQEAVSGGAGTVHDRLGLRGGRRIRKVARIQEPLTQEMK
jgi:hypothetical protein